MVEISDRSSYRLIARVPDGRRNKRRSRRADRSAPSDLAKRTERIGFLSGVQIGPTLVLNLAYPCHFAVVMKDLGRKEVDFTREQHAHQQGMHPVIVPTFSPTSQVDGFALFGPEVKLSA